MSTITSTTRVSASTNTTRVTTQHTHTHTHTQHACLLSCALICRCPAPCAAVLPHPQCRDGDRALPPNTTCVAPLLAIPAHAASSPFPHNAMAHALAEPLTCLSPLLLCALLMWQCPSCATSTPPHRRSSSHRPPSCFSSTGSGMHCGHVASVAGP